MASLLKRLKNSVRLFIRIKSIVNQKSYYPNDSHKSKCRVLFDQLYFVWKYGNYEKYYYAYGFDRKTMDLKQICDEFIVNEPSFIKKIDYHNDHPTNVYRSGRCIIGDKFYFYLFLSSFNFPTPKVLYYTRGGKLFYNFKNMNPDEIVSILDNDIDSFAKPTDGQCGNGAFALRIVGSSVFINDQEVKQIRELWDVVTKTNYIIQERVVQHPQMNKLCPTSVNTIRLLTLITPNEKVIAFRAGLRIGREGSNVDNCAKGGVFVGIDMNTGKLMKKGIIKPPYGNVVFKHPDSGVVFESFEIPFFKEAVDMAKQLHSKLYGIHSVGWDIAITEEGPVFIEGNSKWEVSGTQAAVGGLKFIEKYFD